MKKLGEIIYDQATEVEKRPINHGKFELREQYQSFNVQQSKWFAMTQPQRQQHLTKFAAASLSDISFDTYVGSSSSMSVGCDVSAPAILSVNLETFSGSVRVPRNCLDSIWFKASQLLKTKNEIVPAPGFGEDAKCVLSYWGKKPHLVFQSSRNLFPCCSCGRNLQETPRPGGIIRQS